MAYTVASQIADIRLWVLDLETPYTVSDSQLIQILNHTYIRFWEQFEKRKASTATGALTFNAGTTAPQSITISANVFRLNGVAIDAASGRFVPARDYYAVRERALNEVGTVQEAGLLPAERSSASWNISVVVAPSPEANTNVVVLYVPYPADLTAAGDEMKLPYASQRIVARLAAIETARILGRDMRAMQEILSEIPSEYARAFGISLKGVADGVAGGGSGGEAGGGDGGGDNPVTP